MRITTKHTSNRPVLFCSAVLCCVNSLMYMLTTWITRKYQYFQESWVGSLTPSIINHLPQQLHPTGLQFPDISFINTRLAFHIRGRIAHMSPLAKKLAVNDNINSLWQITFKLSPGSDILSFRQKHIFWWSILLSWKHLPSVFKFCALSSLLFSYKPLLG